MVSALLGLYPLRLHIFMYYYVTRCGTFGPDRFSARTMHGIAEYELKMAQVKTIKFQIVNRRKWTANRRMRQTSSVFRMSEWASECVVFDFHVGGATTNDYDDERRVQNQRRNSFLWHLYRNGEIVSLLELKSHSFTCTQWTRQEKPPYTSSGFLVLPNADALPTPMLLRRVAFICRQANDFPSFVLNAMNTSMLYVASQARRRWASERTRSHTHTHTG